MKCLRRGLSIAVLTTVALSSLAGVADAAARTATYTVRSGDSFFLIADRLGVSVWNLLDTNHLQKTSVLQPGQQLVVPAGGHLPAAPTQVSAPTTTAPTPVTPPAPQRYTVVTNDSLSVIAQRLGVSLNALLSANRLSRSSLIYPGMQLTVPAGGHLPTPKVSTGSTSTTTTTSPAPVAPVAETYVVLAGDGLSIIAQRLGVTTPALLAANSLKITSVIWPGMRLTVPAGGHLPTPKPVPTTTTPDTSTPSSTQVPAPKVSAKLQPMLDFAFAQQGKAYKFNTAGPDTYDCSGLVMAAFAEIGVSLPHRAALQASFGTAIDTSTTTIQAGDLVFLESSPGSGLIDHVGIAISATQWIHAPRTGDVVRIGNIPTFRVAGVRRIVLP